MNNDPMKERGGVRLIHKPTKQVVECQDLSTIGDNFHAAVEKMCELLGQETLAIDEFECHTFNVYAEAE